MSNELKKPIRKYKQGKGYRHEITITKQDIKDLDNAEEVYLLDTKKYEDLKNKIKELQQIITKYEKEIENKNKKIATLEENKTKDQENIIHELKYANKLLDQQHETIKHHRETIKEINQHQYENIEKLNQQHIDQLKETYEQFNKELQKYIAVNHLQNAALKQILELGFIDMIRNKHKKIAKDRIKEFDTKPVYELTKKT